MHNSSW